MATESFITKHIQDISISGNPGSELVRRTAVYPDPQERPIGSMSEKIMRLAAETEGILVDPVYTARALGALISMIEAGEMGKNETVVFWHTGGIPPFSRMRKSSSSIKRKKGAGPSEEEKSPAPENRAFSIRARTEDPDRSGRASGSSPRSSRPNPPFRGGRSSAV